MFEHHHFLSLGEGSPKSVFNTKLLSSTSWTAFATREVNALEKSGDERVRAGDPELPPFPGITSRPRPRAWASGRAARSAGSAYGARVRDSNQGAGVESSLPSAAARTTPGDAAPRCSPPGRAEAPAGGQPEPARPCSARRPGVTPGARGAATVLGSTSSPAWLPCRFTQNVPSTRPLPGIFLLRPGPERLESSLPDPLCGRSSRNSGIARHGSDKLLSSPTLMLFHPRRVRTSAHDHPQISIASTPIKIRDPVPKS